MVHHAYALYCVIVVLLFIGVDYISASLGERKESHFCRIILDSSCHAFLSALVWFAATRLAGPDAYLKQAKLCFVPMQPTGMWRGCNILELLKRNKDVILAFLCGSAVDIDHFIAAGSASIAAATSLPSRPWGHALLTGVVVSAGAGATAAWFPKGSVVHALLSSAYLSVDAIGEHTSLLVFTSYLVHLLRDAVRRGLWICTLPYFPPSTAGPAATAETGIGQQPLQNLYIGTPAIPVCVVLSIYCVLPVIVGALLVRIGGSGSGRGAVEQQEVYDDVDEKAEV
jgi:hypothetical protein